jgi:anti-sigma-K factor RskA
MNIANNAPLLDHLASAYALGTLRGGARRRFETLARQRPAIRAAALIWQTRVGGLNELQAPVPPAPAVWTRIDNLVNAERDHQQLIAARQLAQDKASAAVFSGGWWRSVALWRTLTIGGALSAMLAVATVMSMYEMMNANMNDLSLRLSKAPQIEYVAVLQDGQAGAAMLVTFDPNKKQLKLQRVGGYQEASDKSLQLWALPPQGAPRSLGVLGHRNALQRLVAAEAAVKEVPTLAISLEPKGGVPSEGGPTGPVLFKGALIPNL